jgi:hypothetical protein
LRPERNPIFPQAVAKKELEHLACSAKGLDDLYPQDPPDPRRIAFPNTLPGPRGLFGYASTILEKRKKKLAGDFGDLGDSFLRG